MSSPEAYRALLQAGQKVDVDPYNRYDALASEDDLSLLFEVLTSFYDKRGNSPVITANTVVANPDFERIRESDFKVYYYERFTETLQRYPCHRRSFSLWREGMANRIFYPQFHGREHVNVGQWMEALSTQRKEFLQAFNHHLFGVSMGNPISKRKNLMASLDYKTNEQKEKLREMLEDGTRIFEEIFGYRSRSFIAPCYLWDTDIEPLLNTLGVSFLQGIPFQYQPSLERQFRKKYHFTGQQNRDGQIFLVRNCFFEPSLMEGIDWVDECLKRIQTAFRWSKPAIIGSHRLNYIGFIDVRNRDKNLKLLRELLRRIIHNWPDVEFMHTEQLGRLIEHSKKP
ncbi:MAG: hypothetical protein OEL83_16685 [Desulforhopalus sp.]|nr:hypothetical protein [Desulforhopalus sp.]